MAFDDKFRLSSHAVILKPGSSEPSVLLLKASYGDCAWGLPGGALEPGETIHEALLRECMEELSVEVQVKYLTGVYYHQAYESQVFIFLCELGDSQNISLSEEHSAYQFKPLSTLSEIQQLRVQDCLGYNGIVVSRKF